MGRQWGSATFSWPVSLTHRELTLRPLGRRDRKAWAEVREANRSWLGPWEATLPPGSSRGPGSFGGLIRVLDHQAREGRMLPWAVCWDDGDGVRLGGQLTVSNIVAGSMSGAQIGYWIDERLAGRGIIPLAVALATDHCFTQLGLHRMEIAIRPENAKSLRVVEKLGFRAEGLRPKYLHIDGDWRDHLIFALNSDEVGDGLVARWESTRPIAG
ncbi:GNAT family N-acetyltransferase [Propionibacteriaceae bacterium Y1685]|uniref:GNAT family N-acetyltransferase n=1 Tax=Microlunatus sp. Y1700 TaxID=3418487 RepID=UPI003B8153B1